MFIRRLLITAGLGIALALPLACGEDEGPAERMGKKVDEAAKDVATGAKEGAKEVGEAAERAGRAVQEKAGDVKEKVEEDWAEEDY